jgi:hypothetical protein
MNESYNPTARTGRYPGRIYLALGMLLAVSGVGIYAARFQAKILDTPWYVPILATVGLALVALALVQARSVWRWLAAVFCTLFAAALWLFLLVFLRAPPYTGPVQVGQLFPAFSTTLSDGSTFTQQNLHGDKNTVMVFFRGRW